MTTPIAPAARPGFARSRPAFAGPFGRPIAQLAFDPETGGGTQGGGGQQSAGDAPNVQGLLQRHQGDAMAVIATLLAENHGLRDERRTLRGQVPAQGATVLTGEQAQAWASYQELGALDALKQQLAAAQGASQELQTLKHQALLGQVQEASGYKAAVLAKLPGADKLTFEVRESQVDGKAVKAVFVKDEAGKEAALADYAKAQWADFLPALQAAQQPPPAGTGFVPQSAGAGAPPSTLDAFAKRLQGQRDAAPNPLAPKAPTANS